MHLHTDSETEQWVLRELSLHEKIRSREICVLARDGVVRLLGSTQSYGDRIAVEEATRGAPGVVSVVNEMTVKAPSGSIAEGRHSGNGRSDSGQVARRDETVRRALERAAHNDSRCGPRPRIRLSGL